MTTDDLPADPIRRDTELGHRLLHSLYDNGDLSVDQYDGIGRALFCLSSQVKVERERATKAEHLLTRLIDAVAGEQEASDELERALGKQAVPIIEEAREWLKREEGHGD